MTFSHVDFLPMITNEWRSIDRFASSSVYSHFYTMGRPWKNSSTTGFILVVPYRLYSDQM